ncbi:hypothetical protein CRENBAI_002984 [Crenichthys baileyi]|uniref:Uncharacterized protein n=1 Tax=Crenichthys baileyi TaxID=28760 RepID=A0AAV9QUN2_9TELE
MDLADDHQASSMDLFTFLSREAEKTLRCSAGLSLPQSAYDGSRLAIPCPRTGPLRRRSSPPLHTAVKPSSSSRRKKHRRGAPSCVSASEEESPTAAAATPGAVTPLLAGGRVAASKPTSSSATALSPRLAAALPMPSSLTPAWCSEATPDELEQWLRFFAHQIKSIRRTSLMYSSPELMERIRQMEGDYETAVRQFYCRPPSMPGLQGAAADAEQPTLGLQGAAADAEQPMPGLQGAAADTEQPTPGLQGAAADAEQPTPGLQGAAADAEQPTPGIQSAAAVEQLTSEDVVRETPRLKSSGVPATPQLGLGDASAPAHATESFVLVLASEPREEGLEEEAPSDPVPEGFKEQFVLILASEPKDEGSPGAASASEGSPGSASGSEGSPGSQPVYEALAHWRPPELCACWGRPPGRPPELCACWGRPPGRPSELCALKPRRDLLTSDQLSIYMKPVSYS